MRRLSVDINEVDDSGYGYGISIAGRYDLSVRQNLRYQINAGSGLGRYAGLGYTSADAVVDPSSGELEALEHSSVYAAYQRVLDNKLRANLVLGYAGVDENTFLGLANLKLAKSVHLNLIKRVSKEFQYGAELIHAKNCNFLDYCNELNRLHLQAKYLFD